MRELEAAATQQVAGGANPNKYRHETDGSIVFEHTVYRSSGSSGIGAVQTWNARGVPVVRGLTSVGPTYLPDTSHMVVQSWQLNSFGGNQR